MAETHPGTRGPGEAARASSSLRPARRTHTREPLSRLPDKRFFRVSDTRKKRLPDRPRHRWNGNGGMFRRWLLLRLTELKRCTAPSDLPRPLPVISLGCAPAAPASFACASAAGAPGPAPRPPDWPPARAGTRPYRPGGKRTPKARDGAFLSGETAVKRESKHVLKHGLLVLDRN